VDCRFRLGAPEAGRDAYRQSHVAGAVYAHLDRDLCGPITPGSTGRHPLPEPSDAAQRLGARGIGDGMQVVAYDDAGGALAAARLWWMLRWLGHDSAAVLDGGWQAWLSSGGPVRSSDEHRAPRTFTANVREELVAVARDVDRARQDSGWRVLDARSPERFRGENEPIDPVAGRIPGAHSAPHAANLAPDGTVLPEDALRDRFEPIVAGVAPDHIVCYCGSGVTAAMNVLALEHAGISGARLYAGSWSDWILDPQRPVATG
jgi:thiosulfate/3-mercaptopyruvate sulfurtransferase